MSELLDRLVKTTPSLQKEAIWGELLDAASSAVPQLLHAGGEAARHLAPHLGLGAATAAAGHVGTNALGLAGHKGNIADVLAHHGMQHGLTGSEMNPAARASMKYLFGPESTGAYDAALGVGKGIAHMPTHEQHAHLSAGIASGNLLPAMANAPILKSLHQAAQHEVGGTAPTLQATGVLGKAHGEILSRLASTANSPFDSTGRRALRTAAGAAPLAAAAAGDAVLSGGAPLGLMGHAAVNETRNQVSKTEYGKKYVTDLVQRGMRGEEISKPKQLAMNLGMSPAVLDAHRIGGALRETAEQLGPAAQQPFQALAHGSHEDLANLGKSVAGVRDSAANLGAGAADLKQTAQSLWANRPQAPQPSGLLSKLTQPRSPLLARLLADLDQALVQLIVIGRMRRVERSLTFFLEQLFDAPVALSFDRRLLLRCEVVDLLLRIDDLLVLLLLHRRRADDDGRRRLAQLQPGKHRGDADHQDGEQRRLQVAVHRPSAGGTSTSVTSFLSCMIFSRLKTPFFRPFTSW